MNKLIELIRCVKCHSTCQRKSGFLEIHPKNLLFGKDSVEKFEIFKHLMGIFRDICDRAIV